ncbi:hypothetical protein GCM10020258_05220 [Sphingomonas yabuuchiae]
MDLGLAVLGRLIVGALVGRQHADVAQDRLRHLERRAIAAACDILGQDHVDPVARKHEARNRGLRRHGHGDGAHAGRERGGQEAAIARTDDRALGQRLTGGDRIAQHGALQLGDVGFAAHIIGPGQHVLGPGLELQGGGVDDRADRQGAGGHQDLGLRFDGSGDRDGLGLGNAATGGDGPGE